MSQHTSTPRIATNTTFNNNRYCLCSTNFWSCLWLRVHKNNQYTLCSYFGKQFGSFLYISSKLVIKYRNTKISILNLLIDIKGYYNMDFHAIFIVYLVKCSMEFIHHLYLIHLFNWQYIYLHWNLLAMHCYRLVGFVVLFELLSVYYFVDILICLFAVSFSIWFLIFLLFEHFFCFSFVRPNNINIFMCFCTFLVFSYRQDTLEVMFYDFVWYLQIITIISHKKEIIYVRILIQLCNSKSHNLACPTSRNNSTLHSIIHLNIFQPFSTLFSLCFMIDIFLCFFIASVISFLNPIFLMHHYN